MICLLNGLCGSCCVTCLFNRVVSGLRGLVYLIKWVGYRLTPYNSIPIAWHDMNPDCHLNSNAQSMWLDWYKKRNNLQWTITWLWIIDLKFFTPTWDTRPLFIFINSLTTKTSQEGSIISWPQRIKFYSNMPNSTSRFWLGKLDRKFSTPRKST